MNMLRFLHEQARAAAAAGDMEALVDWLDALEEELVRVASFVVICATLEADPCR